MGHKPFAVILFAGLLALPIACGDDDGGGSTDAMEGGEGGSSAGTGGMAKGGSSGKGGTAGKGGSGTGGSTAGSGGGDQGGAGAGGSEPTDGGTGGTGPDQGGAGAGPGGSGGVGPGGTGGTGGTGDAGGGGVGGDAGGQGGDGGQGGGGGEPVPTKADVDALWDSVCSKEPGGVACASYDTCRDEQAFNDLPVYEEAPECIPEYYAFVKCMDERPLTDFVCEQGELSIADAHASCLDAFDAMLACLP